MFYVEDGWLDWFDVSVRVTDIPDGVDLKVELIHVLTADGEAGEGVVAESEDTGSGGTEELSIGEGWWPGDQSGWYHVVVSSRGGSTCDGDYTLIIAADSGGLPDDDDDDEPVVEDCSGWTSDTDIHEPNDPVAKAFGDMDGEEFDVEGGYLYPDTDIDRYSFVATDGWIDGWDGVFDIQARLTEVPAGVNLKLELWHMETEDGEPGAGLLGEPAETGLGGTAEVSAGGFWDHLTDWSSGSGLYEVVVTSVDGTSSCNPYTLTISADTR
jgi:hypothetical protein